MKTQKAINYFGGQEALAKVLGISSQAISQWKVKTNWIVPELSAYKLHALTGGKLRVIKKDYQ